MRDNSEHEIRSLIIMKERKIYERQEKETHKRHQPRREKSPTTDFRCHLIGSWRIRVLVSQQIREILLNQKNSFSAWGLICIFQKAAQSTAPGSQMSFSLPLSQSIGLPLSSTPGKPFQAAFSKNFLRDSSPNSNILKDSRTLEVRGSRFRCFELIEDLNLLILPASGNFPFLPTKATKDPIISQAFRLERFLDFRAWSIMRKYKTSLIWRVSLMALWACSTKKSMNFIVFNSFQDYQLFSDFVSSNKYLEED